LAWCSSAVRRTSLCVRDGELLELDSAARLVTRLDRNPVVRSTPPASRARRRQDTRE
jgi:hypothetical protein